MIIEEKPKPIMKIMVSIKLLLFVMSAHSFKSIFYFLIIRSAFEIDRPKCEWMYSIVLAVPFAVCGATVRLAMAVCFFFFYHSQIFVTQLLQAYRWHIRPQPDFSDNFWYFIASIFHVISLIILPFWCAAWANSFSTILCGCICLRHIYTVSN